MKDLLRSKIIEVISCDIYNPNPLYPRNFPTFDVLTMGGVADAISKTEEELILSLKNSFTLLKPGGYFVGFFAKNFKSWTHLDKFFEVFPIDESYIQQLFPRLGLKILTLTNSVPPDYKQEYEGIFAVSARKTT